MKIFALASLFLLQGQTVFAEECCPANEAVGWKCGTVIYRCASNHNETVAVASCDKGVGGAQEVLLAPAVCAGMQSMAIEIGKPCFHGLIEDHDGFDHIRDLSNRICVSGSGEITKYDGGTCHSCGTKEDLDTIAVLSPETNAEEEVFVQVADTVESGSGCCGDDSVVVAWKCGNRVYRCMQEDAGEAIASCEQSAGGGKQILIEAEQCEAMQALSINEGCKVPDFKTKPLDNRICVDSQGMISMDDGSCSSCGQLENDQEPVTVSAPEEPAPQEPAPQEPAPQEPAPQEREPAPEEPTPDRDPAPEVPLETPVQATDPPQLTRAPIAEPEPEAACPDDIILLETDGTTDFPDGALTIISQDTGTVTVQVNSDLSSNNFNDLYYQYYETAFSEKCYSRTSVLETSEIPANDSFQVTIECTHSGNFALLEFWVVDDQLDTATNDAVIPQCCQASDEDQALGVTKFLVEVKCITSCPDSTA